MATASGLSDYDYQNLSNLTMGLKNLNQLDLVNKIPIPPEIMEHFKSKLSALNYNANIANTCKLHILSHFRYQMSLYDGIISGNRSCVVDYRFRHLRKYRQTHSAIIACTM